MRISPITTNTGSKSGWGIIPLTQPRILRCVDSTVWLCWRVSQ